MKAEIYYIYSLYADEPNQSIYINDERFTLYEGLHFDIICEPLLCQIQPCVLEVLLQNRSTLSYRNASNKLPGAYKFLELKGGRLFEGGRSFEGGRLFQKPIVTKS